MTNNLPYIEEEITTVTKVLKYNPEYGDDRVCKCGHTYYRHFDSYHQMEDIGCKYCFCQEFVESKKVCSNCLKTLKQEYEDQYIIKLDDEILEGHGAKKLSLLPVFKTEHFFCSIYCLISWINQTFQIAGKNNEITSD